MGFTENDARQAMNLRSRADQALANRENYVRDIEQLEADVAAVEADGNRKTRTQEFMDALAPGEDGAKKDYKHFKHVVTELGAVKDALRSTLPDQEDGQKKGAGK